MKKIKIILILLLSVLLCLSATSCLPLLSAGLDLIFHDALDTSDIENREVSYDMDFGGVSVTFVDGDLCAKWQVSDGYEYTVTVDDGKSERTYDNTNNAYSDGLLNLSELGYTFSQNLDVSLNKKVNSFFSTHVSQVDTEYQAIKADIYDEYTKTSKAGFKDIDRYIASRQEWFEYWSYLIVFRENYQYEDGCYIVKSEVYLAYDYRDLYKSGTSYYDAFAYEVYSAIDAYEDSAAYSYTFDVSDDGLYGEVYLKFFYPTTPSYTSDNASKYVNAVDAQDKPHYSTLVKDRQFAIDSVEKTAMVESTDQLYFAIKKGYRPLPIKGSNAEYIYNEMRSILSQIIADSYADDKKAHLIYDYIVDTVVYDYDFTDNIYPNESISTGQLFSYRCMYMEGVFGMNSKKEFVDSEKIAICDGLSKAYLCMTTIEGMECLKISGTVAEEGHAWNKIKINGTWYMVDTTWGNALEESTGKEYLSHKYLLVPDDNRHVESPYFNYPVANSRYYFGPSIDNNPDENSNGYFPFLPGKPTF